MKRLIALVTIFILFSNVSSAASLEDMYREQVTRYVNNSDATSSMRAFGFRDDALNVGYIVDSPGRYFDVTYRLKRGYVYAFDGACDDDCRDVDLTLYGPNGNKVAEHIAGDDNPSIWIFTAEDGQYRVRATIPTCNAPIGCYVAVKGMLK
jgi:hypothetical protein